MQCSNCGDTWYQPPPGQAEPTEQESLQAHFARVDSELEADAAKIESEPSATVDETLDSSEDLSTTEEETPDLTPNDPSESAQEILEPVQSEVQEATVPSDPVEDVEDLETKDPPYDRPNIDDIEEATDNDAEEVSESSEPPQPRIPARELDASIARILREEAAREQSAREQEVSGGLEVQADLGLEQAPAEASKEQTRDRIGPMRGQPEAPSEKQDAPARRDLLPDIEEISSSLGGEEGLASPSAQSAASSEQNARGFRTGFLLAVLIFITATVIYLTAHDISQSIPSLEGPLASYVDMVNAGRLQLAEQFSSLKDWLSHMSQPASE